jgi:hypothetical protein
MIWRALTIVTGLGVIAAATHANVMHSGGYGTNESWLAIAVSALLAVGMGYVAQDGRHGPKILAIFLIVCLLAGEAYWLFLNTERELQARADKERPLQVAHENRVKAQKRIDEAKEEKKKADEAALMQAALPGCRANCAKLLTDAKESAKTELDNARAAFAALPKDASSVSLADNLGFSRWAWDLFMASLRGLAIIGGSIAVGLALHPRRKAAAHVAVAPPRQSEVFAKVEKLQTVKAIVPKRTPRRRSPHSSPLAITARPINEREHVSHFLRIAVRPDPKAEMTLRQLNDRYPGWCREQSVDPLPPAQLGQQLRSIIDAIGLECVPTGKDVIIRGAALN